MDIKHDIVHVQDTVGGAGGCVSQIKSLILYTVHKYAKRFVYYNYGYRHIDLHVSIMVSNCLESGLGVERELEKELKTSLCVGGQLYAVANAILVMIK